MIEPLDPRDREVISVCEKHAFPHYPAYPCIYCTAEKENPEFAKRAKLTNKPKRSVIL